MRYILVTIALHFVLLWTCSGFCNDIWMLEVEIYTEDPFKHEPLRYEMDNEPQEGYSQEYEDKYYNELKSEEWHYVE